MACYHPGCAVADIDPISGELRWHFMPNNPMFEVDGVTSFMVPCKKCIGCRLDNAREWANRMMLELDHSKTAIFCTLTYDPAHLPHMNNGLPTLRKKDIQDFLKRLRYYYSDKEIRFYAAGEYGPQTHRPHYHAIIYGLSVEDFLDRVSFGRNALGQEYYTSPRFTSIWQNGFTQMSSVNFNTCAYVARYVQKKAFKDVDKLPVEKEFSLMSRRPGIGAYFLEEHPDWVKDSKITVYDPNSITQDFVKRIPYPQYFKRKLKDIDPERYARERAERCTIMAKRFHNEIDKTDKKYYDYLADKEHKTYTKAYNAEHTFRKEV